MAKRFDFWRNKSEHIQRDHLKKLGELRFVDELPCAPGGHTPLVNGRFAIQPGQIIRVPIEFGLAGNLHKRPYLLKVTSEDFEAAAQAEVGDDPTSAPAEAAAGTEAPWTHTYKGLRCRVVGESQEAGKAAKMTIAVENQKPRTLNASTWEAKAEAIKADSADIH